ncbi:MAG: pyruvate, phosphate dikinase/phosphoenolpyruvate synthase regulator [Desulfobulbaceae bacterium]|nr:pyruvate, phosphate dikinase/phosphoenolpyruvate synthase regulator [Desulfobulbaceae bacterium]
MWTSKDVYYVSGSTGLLAEDMGQALLCQFQEISFNQEKIPFIKTKADALRAMEYIRENSGGRRPLVFCSILNPRIRNVFDSPDVEFFNIFGNFLELLENCLEAKALRVTGYSRHADNMTLANRVEAIHYSIDHDDGIGTKGYDDAEVILIGVSRSGKTPVSIYIATHMGIKAANFPLTSEHLDNYELPADILKNRKKVVGLTTSPQLLHQIRDKRYSGSNYAKISTCTRELNQAEQIFIKYGIRVVNTSGKSIEETAVQVTQLVGISKSRWR